MEKDLYKILGVSSDATEDQISKAYRQLAMKYHPDTNPDDQDAVDKFKEATEAYEVLKDTDKRSHYDMYGSVGDGGSNFDIDPFSVFGDLFGRGFTHSHRHPAKGENIYRDVVISLAEAYSGTKQTFSIPNKFKVCETCNGAGVTSWDTCKLCSGKGRINSHKGSFSVSMSCSNCRGSGRVSTVTCDTCNGVGKLDDQNQDIEIDVPAGIENGVQLLMRGRGQWIPNGIAGDLICRIIVLPHRLYEREGVNLYCEVPITYAQSILGHEVLLTLPSGQICNVKIPPKTESNMMLKVRSMGMPLVVGQRDSDSGRGDLFVKVQVVLPENPSESYMELVKKLSEIDDKEIYRQISNFNELSKNNSKVI